jgi:hypothetical protein
MRGQSCARTSRKSGSRASAPCCSISRAILSQPCREQREQATSSITILLAISRSVTPPPLLIAAAARACPYGKSQRRPSQAGRPAPRRALSRVLAMPTRRRAGESVFTCRALFRCFNYKKKLMRDEPVCLSKIADDARRDYPGATECIFGKRCIASPPSWTHDCASSQ